jgi:hypothetical protein
MVLEKQVHKDLLVFYQGGGYDGCIWEWNFFSFDKDGEFHNLFTSGCMGVKDDDMETVYNMINNPKAHKDETSNSVYVYDLTKDDCINEFQSEHNVPNVVSVVNHLNGGEYGEYSSELYFVCDVCEQKITEYGEMEDYHGCGGIAITADTKICQECHSLRSCDYCGEYDADCQEQMGYCSYHFSEVLGKMFQGEFNHVEFDSQSNSFYIVPTEDIDSDTVKDMLNDGDFWLIVTAEKEHAKYQKYLVTAGSEKDAVNDVCSGLLDGNYYEVIETVNFDYSKAFEYLENNGLTL